MLIDLVVLRRLKEASQLFLPGCENMGNAKHRVKLEMGRAIDITSTVIYCPDSLTSLPSLCNLIGRRQNVYPLKTNYRWIWPLEYQAQLREKVRIYTDNRWIN